MIPYVVAVFFLRGAEASRGCLARTSACCDGWCWKGRWCAWPSVVCPYELLCLTRRDFLSRQCCSSEALCDQTLHEQVTV
uniref:Putative secreted protein n=1 Tax=Ixodes ricinus TaxID=34613 RepID=A0A6B0TXT8_IXORI